MSSEEEDDALIISRNGDVRGRKGLVQEIKRNTIDILNSLQINQRIDRDTLWTFDSKKLNNLPEKDYVIKVVSSTQNLSQSANTYGRQFPNARNLSPIIENNTNTLRSSFTTTINSDQNNDNLAWSEYEEMYRKKEIEQTQNNNGKNIMHNSYSLNTKENVRFLQLPQTYTHDYGNTVIEYIIPKSAKQWEAGPLNWNDVNPTTQSSRNSSIRSYQKALPVGKFATQKFRVLQDEEDYTENPRIFDVENQQVSNWEKTCEFDYVAESIVMNICDFKTANVDIKIEEVKYSRKNISEKLWSRKKTEILRSVNIDLLSSGQGKMLRSFIYDTMINIPPLHNDVMSNYTVSVDEFQLKGKAAFTIFNILLEIAERDTSSISKKTQEYKNKFSPRYLLALLREEETSDYF